MQAKTNVETNTCENREHSLIILIAISFTNANSDPRVYGRQQCATRNGYALWWSLLKCDCLHICSLNIESIFCSCIFWEPGYPAFRYFMHQYIYISNKMLYQQRYSNHIPWIFVARVENDCPSWFAGCLICVFHSEADLTDGKSCRLWTNKLHFFSHSFYSIQKCSSAACVAGFHQQKRSVPNCIEQRRCYLVHCAWQGINYVYIYILISENDLTI